MILTVKERAGLPKHARGCETTEELAVAKKLERELKSSKQATRRASKNGSDKRARARKQANVANPAPDKPVVDWVARWCKLLALFGSIAALSTWQSRAVRKGKIRVNLKPDYAAMRKRGKKFTLCPSEKPPTSATRGCFGDGYDTKLESQGASWQENYADYCPEDSAPNPDATEGLSLSQQSDNMLETAIAPFRGIDGEIDWKAYVEANTVMSKNDKQYLKLPRLPGDYTVPANNNDGSPLMREGKRVQGYVAKSEMIPVPVSSAMVSRFYDRVLSSECNNPLDMHGNRYLGAHPRTDEQFSRSSRTSAEYVALPPNDETSSGCILDNPPLPYSLGQFMPELVNPLHNRVMPASQPAELVKAMAIEPPAYASLAELVKAMRVVRNRPRHALMAIDDNAGVITYGTEAYTLPHNRARKGAIVCS